MPKKLIITADDFGADPFITRGIWKAVKADSVTAVSCIMNTPESVPEVIKLRDYILQNKKNIGIGVHLTVTSGSPLCGDKVGSLLDNKGRFMEVKKYNFTKAKPAHIEKECEAQIMAILSALDSKLPLDHISSHHGLIAIYAPYRQRYFKLARKYGVPVRNPILMGVNKDAHRVFRHSKMREKAFWGGAGRFLKDALLKNPGHADILVDLMKNAKYENQKKYVASQRKKGVPIPDYFFDGYYGYGTMLKLKEIFKYYPEANNINAWGEMVVHLGSGHYDRKKVSNGIDAKYFDKRERELRNLNDYGYLESFSDDFGVDISTFKQFVKK